MTNTPRIEPPEKWLPIAGHEGLYEISSYGRVKSFWRATEKILSPCIVGSGYKGLTLRDKSHSHSPYLVARLVAKHFVPNPDNKPEVNHINGIKADNWAENLEWVTRGENIHHSFATGLRSNHGENHPKVKLTKLQVERIRLMHEVTPKFSLTKIARLFNVQRPAIYKIVNKLTWNVV